MCVGNCNEPKKESESVIRDKRPSFVANSKGKRKISALMNEPIKPPFRNSARIARPMVVKKSRMY